MKKKELPRKRLRRQADIKLAESHQILDIIMSHTNMLVTYMDPQFNFIKVNQAYARADEKRPAFFIGKNYFQLYPHAENEAIFKKVVKTGKPYFAKAKPFEYAEHPERGMSYRDWSLIPFKNNKNQVNGLVLTLIDVTRNTTAHKQVEERMRESEEKYMTMVEYSNDMIWTLDKKGNFTYINKKSEEITGYKIKEKLSNGFMPIILEEDLEMVFDVFRKTLKGKHHHYEVRIHDASRKKQITLSVNTAPIYKDKEIIGTVSFGRDITKRKKMEEMLRESEIHYRTVVEDQTELICRFQPDCTLTFVNEAYCRYFDKKREDLIGYNWLSLLPEEEREMAFQYLTSLSLENPFATYEHRVISSTGEILWQEWTDRAIFDKQGHPVEFQSVGRDITERKEHEENVRQLREQLTHTGRVASLGELTAAMAHELNQPLTAIMSNTQAGLRFLKAGQPDMEEIQEIFKDILSDNRRAAEIISKLKKLVVKKSEERSPVDINEIIQEVVTLLRSDIIIRNVDLKLKLKKEIPRVKADRIQIQQVILNLALNSFDALNNQTRGKRKMRIGNRVDNKNGLIEVYVRDSGPGLKSADLEQIFSPFYSSKPQGMGMGLTINRTIIEAHEGKIRAHNNPEGGLTVCFTLPIPEEG